MFGISKRCGRLLAACMSLALLLAVGVSPAFATAPTLPDVGVDVGDWIPVVAAAMGVIVLAVVGSYFAFLLIKRGLKWAGRAFG